MINKTRLVRPTLDKITRITPNLAQAAGDYRAKAVRAVLRVVRPLKCLLSQAAGRRTEAGRLPWTGGQAAAVGRAGLADEACQGRVLAGATGRNG